MADHQNNTYLQALLDGLPVEAAGKGQLDALYQTCGFEPGQLRSLKSIVGQVGDATINRYFQPRPLQLDEAGVFAKEDTPPGLEAWEAEVKKEFEAFQETLQGSEHYAYSLYHFLHAYGSRVAYGKHDDASLFDRNRVLAAVASCLDKTGGEKQFLIVKGAISGIQKYIYHNIKAEQIGDAQKAAKRLRGRSFLVAFINQVIAEYLVEQLGLQQANVLFVGGGQFTMLLPDDEDTVQQLRSLLKEVNLGLLKNVGPQLSLMADWVSCTGNIGERFAEEYQKVHIKLEAQKQRRYQSYLTEVFEYFDKHDEQAEVDQRNKARKEEVRIGTLAPYANFILEVNGDPAELSKLDKGLNQEAAIKNLSFLGKRFYILKDEETGIEREEELEGRLYEFLSDERNLATLETYGQLKIIGLNKPEIKKTIKLFSNIGLTKLSYGFRFVGNYAPLYIDRRQFDSQATDGAVMLFEDLAKLTKKGQSVQDDGKIATLAHQQLGVLRLDVDDLGVIFARGMGEENTMERLLSLSREFQLFFGGYFNNLAEKHHMYITYSGGDDAFLIGSWWNSICFARELEKEFRQFSCNNKDVSFSAGLFICNPHYPIPRLARDGEDVEDLAKGYPKHKAAPEKEKDAFYLFNHGLRWKDFQRMMEFSDSLQDLVVGEEGGSFKRSMIRRFLRIINVHNDPRFSQVEQQELTFERMRHISALHGLLARHNYGSSQLEQDGARLDRAGELIKEMVQKANEQSEKNQAEFDHYTVPLHIALYQSKTN